MRRHALPAGVLAALALLTSCSGTAATSGTPTPLPTASASASALPAAPPGDTPVAIYAQAGAGMLAAAAAADPALVYVPNGESNTVTVIDQKTLKTVGTYPVGRQPQHVVPSWDLKTLWVNDNSGNDLVPFDPRTGLPGKAVPVDDPYNLYFTPDGTSALVMAEARQRIDVRDPQTMALKRSLRVDCPGLNHLDYDAALTFFVASCEFGGRLLVVSADAATVHKTIDLNSLRTPDEPTPAMARAMGGPAAALRGDVNSMPQDVRLSPDGRTFLAADMVRNGVWLIDATTLTVRSFLPTGKGAHGIYPSRDASVLYVSNRDEGSVSVLDAATLTVRTTWRLPTGSSPDMGGVSADGTRLWLSGRYSSEIYVIDTADGHLVAKIPVGRGPHGLALWPQPGRFSLGHTGNMR